MLTKISLQQIRTLATNESHRVNELERKFLVWTGKYKSVHDVPNLVKQNVIERTRNIMRIRIANGMMASTIVACLVMVAFGKRDAKRGVSIQQQNLEWHRKFNAEK